MWTRLRPNRPEPPGGPALRRFRGRLASVDRDASGECPEGCDANRSCALHIMNVNRRVVLPVRSTDSRQELLDRAACLTLTQRSRLAPLRFYTLSQLELGDRNRAVLAVALGLVVLHEARAEDRQRRFDYVPVLTDACAAEVLGHGVEVRRTNIFCSGNIHVSFPIGAGDIRRVVSSPGLGDRSDVEVEADDVAFLDDVVAAFEASARCPASRIGGSGSRP